MEKKVITHDIKFSAISQQTECNAVYNVQLRCFSVASKLAQIVLKDRSSEQNIFKWYC